VITEPPDDAGRQCPSQFQLDRLSANELTSLERMRLERHVASCPTCERGLVDRAVERAQFVPDPRTWGRLAATAPRSRRWRRWTLAAAPAIACACVLIAMQVRQSGSGVSRHSVTKGGIEISLVVERNGVRAALGLDGRVRPGDRLQVAVRVPEARFVAVYSIDGTRSVSRYAPVEAAMVAIAPGSEQVLPNSTILDDVLGRETLVVFTCVRDQPDATLRAYVLGGAIPGCDVSRTELIKAAE
jgi:hypothetical protein